MQQAIIAPTESGYDLNDLKRAVLTYDKVLILDPGDRDLFPGSAFGMAMGMPPIMSTPMGAVRPLGKRANYDQAFDELVEHCKPLIDAGVVEITSCWNRSETEGNLTIGMVPMGGYPLNVGAVLQVYRGIARDNEFLRGALETSAVELALSDEAAALSVNGAADGGINNDPALPALMGELRNEEIRPTLTVLARSRIATALKIWGVAEERGIVPVLPDTSAGILDRLANSARAAIDATEQDPYWTRRTAILDTVMGEFVSDERLSQLPAEQLMRYRTEAMRRGAEARSRLFVGIREMAQEPTNLDLNGFRDRVRDKFKDYVASLATLNEERKTLGWQVRLTLGQAVAATGSGTLLGSGVFHVAMPFALSGTALAALAWALGKVEDYAPAIRENLAQERAIKGSNEYAVFRHFNYLVPMSDKDRI